MIENQNELLAQYAAGPNILIESIKGLGESQLNLSLDTNTWTIRQIILHIVDGDDIWKTCIKAALGNEKGLFSLQWYWDIPQLEWGQLWNYDERSIEIAIALLRANRNHILEIVQKTPSAWEKTIRIKFPNREEERISVADVISMHVEHMIGHTEDIRKIRTAHNI